MKPPQAIDRHARSLEPGVQTSVYRASKLKTESRLAILNRDFAAPDRMRAAAGRIKQHTLEHLDRYLGEAAAQLESRGAQVHWADDADAANRIILDIMRRNHATRMVKSKSMASEETGLVPYLERHGIEAVETDLGEFIVQIDHDHPSHIVTPIIHKNRKEIARSFEREGLGPYNDDPATITRRARAHLRRKYLEAEVGMTGANFVVAESGRIVLVTNEGNARFSIAPARVHIALAGIEKLVPHDRDLGLFLNLLARSATAQQLTVYTQFISGPRRHNQPHGPEEMHVVFLDNGRSRILQSEFREILRCIRCGACLNVCPIYRQAGGHAYRSVYPGPVGAVLSPLLAGQRFPELADLPKASSLCGACNEVCPVDIPLPDLLLRLRDKAKREKAGHAMKGTPPMGAWAILASSPVPWRSSLVFGKAVDYLPPSLFPIPAAQRWCAERDLPPWRGGRFRRWFNNRNGHNDPNAR